MERRELVVSHKRYMIDMVQRYGYSFIPLRFKQDGDVMSGKIPGISNWTKYCKELPTEEEINNWQYLGVPTGVGICCGEASNICCIDIDTNDSEAIRRIMSIMPDEAIRIIGNPTRGGKFLFRMYEYDPEDITVQTEMNKWGVMDILCDNRQIAVPPSIHTELKNGERILYKWDGHLKDGEYPPKEYLPVLTKDLIYAFGEVLAGALPKDIQKEVPIGTIEVNKEEGRQRWNWAIARISELARNKTKIDQAVKILIKEDLSRHGYDDMVFRTKFAPTASPEINALYGYANQIAKTNRKKSYVECEIPSGLDDIPDELEESIVDYEDWPLPDVPSLDPKPLPPFDLMAIPSQWRNLVREVAESNDVPYEACFFFLLSALSSIIGNKRWIQFKRQNTAWLEAHNIWAVYVSPPGSRKSQIIKVLSYPIKQLQKGINDQHDSKVRSLIKIKEIADAQIAELDKLIKKESVRVMKEECENNILKDLQKQRDELKDMVTVPDRRQLVVNSATNERLIELMTINPSGLFMVFNELDQLLSNFNKKGYEALRSTMLNTWDGNSQISHQTKTSGNMFVENACTGLYGNIQPSIVRMHMDMIMKDVQDDGFWSRPFFVCNDKKGSVNAVDSTFDHSKHQAAYDIFHKAHDVPDDKGRVIATDAAYNAYMKFESMNNQRLKDSTDARSKFYGKFTGKVVKIASLLEFIKNNGSFSQPISIDSFNEAVYIMERQLLHIDMVCPELAAADIVEIVDEMKAGIIEDETTIRVLERSHKRLFKPGKSSMVIDELERRNIARVTKRGKSYFIKISPYILDKSRNN